MRDNSAKNSSEYGTAYQVYHLYSGNNYSKVFMNASCNVHHIDGGVITWGISIFTESVRNSGLIVGTHLNCLKQRSNKTKISKSTLYKCTCYKSTPLLCCSGAGGLYLLPVVNGLYGGVIYVLLRLGITLTALLTLRCKTKNK